MPGCLAPPRRRAACPIRATPNLRPDFPPLRRARQRDRPRRARPGHLVGSAAWRELDLLSARIAAQRLIWVVGQGDSGKTRLALDAA